MTENEIKKTEEAMLIIRDQLDNVVIPDADILMRLNEEMRNVFLCAKHLRNYIETLEKAYGSLEQYGIADEINQYNNK